MMRWICWLLSILAFPAILGSAILSSAAAGVMVGGRLQHMKDFGDAANWGFVMSGDETIIALTLSAASLAVVAWLMFSTATQRVNEAAMDFQDDIRAVLVTLERSGRWKPGMSTLYPPPPKLRLRGVFLRRTDWSGGSMTDGDVSRSDFSNANLTDVDFERTNLDGTILRGADLTGARNLTHEQLAKAVIDEMTKLPSYIDRSRLPSPQTR